jgi:hypothetical protein
MATSSRTAFYISQLQPYAKKHLEAMKEIGNRFPYGEREQKLARAEIRGYLTALNDAGIIGDVAFRCLYIYYTSFMNKEAKE